MIMRAIYISVIGLLCTVLTAAAQPAQLHLSQQECRRMALEASEELQSAENRLRQAELDRRIAATAALPNLSASATGAYMLPDVDMMGMELLMRGTYMAGLSLTQPIYTGGKISAARRLARIGESASEEQLRMARMDVTAEADNAYWTYISVRSKVRMMESYAAQLDTLYRMTATTVRAGMATENDLLRVDAKRSEIEYQLQRTRNGADLCRLSLCRIVGAGPDTDIIPVDTLPAVESPRGLDDNTELRPELRLLQRQIDAQRQQIRMTRADMLPTVGLSLGYTYYGNIKMRTQVDLGNGMTMPYTQEFRDGIGIGMLAVKIPIFHWGEARKKVRKARYELRNAELEMQKNSELIGLQVQQAIRNLTDGYTLIGVAQKALRQSEENLRVMRNRYEARLSPLTDLLDAQSQWQQSQSNLIEARTQFKIYETEYLRATGRLE